MIFLKPYQKQIYSRENNKIVPVMVSGKILPISDINLQQIITEMLEPDAQKRPDSKTVLEGIKKNYNKVFVQNSGLYSILRCLCNLPYLRSYFLNKFKVQDIKFIESKPYSEKLLYWLKYLLSLPV